MTGIPTTERINQLLAEVYDAEGCRIWWRATNRNLGSLIPAVLWAYGSSVDRSRVQREAERLAGGVR